MFTPSQSQKELLEKHLDMVLNKNDLVNITRIATHHEGELLHIEDSLTGIDTINDLSGTDLCDMGSGAGYPGIPIAICTNKNVTLIESVKKKSSLLSEFVRNLGLTNVTVLPYRTEEVAEQHKEFDIVTARALSSLPSLLELASPLLRMNGYFLAYKGSNVNKEIEHARPIFEKLGMVFVNRSDFTLSDGSTHRSLLLFQKTDEPKVKLPRRPGMAQKRPYK